MTVRPLPTLIAASLVTGGLFAAVGSPADAKKKPRGVAKIVDHCTGTRLESHPLTNAKGKARGHVELWYSSRDGGTNCVQTFDDAAGRRMMSATLVVQDRPSSSDTAVYEQYAGGAAVTQTDGKCVQWGGYVDFGKQHHMWLNDRWSHCGG